MTRIRCRKRICVKTGAFSDGKFSNHTVLERKIPGLVSSPTDPFVLFTSFVDHFLAQAQDNWTNLHLRPFHIRCPVCAMDVDYVGKTETSEEDVDFIIRELNFPGRPPEVKFLSLTR